jgi:hypothetical protein
MGPHSVAGFGQYSSHDFKELRIPKYFWRPAESVFSATGVEQFPAC